MQALLVASLGIPHMRVLRLADHRYPEPFSSPDAFHSLVVYLPSEFFQQRSDP